MRDPHLESPEIETLITRLRRDIHQEPEVGLDLPRTQAKIISALEGLPLNIAMGDALSSVTAVLRGTSSKTSRTATPVVLLRADMDALPVTETTGLSFASRTPGVMHACGHDLHTAMLVGAAHLLSRRRAELVGDVIFMFQPGEEGCDGARLMVDEGVLEAAGATPQAALALHVFTTLGRHGTFFTRGGVMLAASDQIHVTVTGKGGHGSKPHLARDPITASALMINGLQTFVTRRFDVFSPVIVSVGTFVSGTRANIVPPDARFEATVRTFSSETRAQFQAQIHPLLKGIAAAHDVEVDISWVPGYPVTVNDHHETRFVSDCVSSLFGEERLVHANNPLPGAEDFSRILSRVPGTFLGLVAGQRDRGEDQAFNHAPDAQFDDSLLIEGATLQTEWAIRRLGTEAEAS